MKLGIFLKCFFILLLVFVVSAKDEFEDDVNLISKVCAENKETSVLVFHYADRNNFWEKQYLLKIMRLLSKKRLMSITADFKDSSAIKQYYWLKSKDQIHGNQPMIVIILSDQESLNQFKEMYDAFRLEQNLFFLILFIKTDKEYLWEFCLKPSNKMFKLRLDALMVVKCYDENKLRAWYTLDGEEMTISPWAIWDPEIMFLTMILDWKHKKINLHGKELRIATVESSALTEWTKDNKLDGYFGQVLYELQQSMNFTWRLVRKEREYGSWNATGNYWTGATDLLYKQEIDLLVTDLALTSLRMTVVDYTFPILSVRSMLYVKKPEAGVDIKWLGYFKFFDYRIWVALIVLIMITPLILTIFKIKIRESYVLSLLLMENYLNIWGIYCQQGLLEFPAESALRLIYFSVFVSALIVFAFYSAFLISRLTYPTPDNFMPDMEAFIKDGTYKLITLKNGADYNIFEFGKTDTLKTMFKFMLRSDELPESVQAGFDMVCDQKVGFFVVETSLKIHGLNIKCQLHQIKTSLLEISTMALPKNSEYKGEINRNFLRYEVNGMMKRFYEKYFYQDSVLFQKKSQVTIWEIVILLAIVACGIFVSFMLLLIEHKIRFIHKVKTGKGRSSKIKKQELIPFDYSKWFNFENQRMNPNRYNLNGDVNVKFIKNDHKHKIAFSPVINRISFEY